MKKKCFQVLLMVITLFVTNRTIAQSLSVSDYTETLDNYTSPTVALPGTNYVAGYLHGGYLFVGGGAYVDFATDGDFFDFCDAARNPGAVLPELSDPSITYYFDTSDLSRARLSVNFTAYGQTALFRVRATEYNSGIWSYNYYDIEFRSYNY